tara:strand:+ start:934 stop:1401 length:468 start_codon:yes stop_codon:yes gene_type:complete
MDKTANRSNAQRYLKSAMQYHAKSSIQSAIKMVHKAIAIDPDFAEAYAYLGNTLVTRTRQFDQGLQALRHAVKLAPEDATILYTTGWCEEYIANALEKPRHKHQAVPENSKELYIKARLHFLEALKLTSDLQLIGDIEDMLDVVSAATGQPWQEE